MLGNDMGGGGSGQRMHGQKANFCGQIKMHHQYEHGPQSFGARCADTCCMPAERRQELYERNLRAHRDQPSVCWRCADSVQGRQGLCTGLACAQGS